MNGAVGMMFAKAGIDFSCMLAQPTGKEAFLFFTFFLVDLASAWMVWR